MHNHVSILHYLKSYYRIDEMSRACTRRTEKEIGDFSRTPLRKRSLEINMCKGEYNIKINLQGRQRENVDWI
jgi:hypothetical protein